MFLQKKFDQSVKGLMGKGEDVQQNCQKVLRMKFLLIVLLLGIANAVIGRKFCNFLHSILFFIRLQRILASVPLQITIKVVKYYQL